MILTRELWPENDVWPPPMLADLIFTILGQLVGHTIRWVFLPLLVVIRAILVLWVQLTVLVLIWPVELELNDTPTMLVLPLMV